MSCHLPSYCVTANAGKAGGLPSLHLRDPMLMQIMAHSGERNSKINTEDVFSMTDWPILKVRCLLNKGAALFSSWALLVHALILHSLRFLLLAVLQLYGWIKFSYSMPKGLLHGDEILLLNPALKASTFQHSASVLYSVKKNHHVSDLHWLLPMDWKGWKLACFPQCPLIRSQL